MEILIDSDVLLEGLNSVKPIVSNKGLVPILNCFMLEAKANKFFISASSDDMTMRWAIGEDAEYIEKQKKEKSENLEDGEEKEDSKIVRKDVLKVHEEGSIATLASRFHAIIGKLGGSYPVSLKTDDEQNLSILCDTADAKATLVKDSSADLDDFPKVEDGVGGKEITLPENFIEMLKITQISICEIESRLELKGLLVKIKDGIFSLTSCDNKRICQTTGKIKDEKVDEAFFISRESVKELIRMKPTSFIVGPKNHLTFKNITTDFVIQLLENRFPDLEKFIAFGKEPTEVVEINRRELKDAIDWVAISSETIDSRIDLEIEDQRMTLFSELNTSKQKRRIKVNTPAVLELSCNPAYFLDFLNVIDDKNVNFFYNDKIKKVFFTRENCTYIITPKK